jgi:hypothetical protein
VAVAPCSRQSEGSPAFGLLRRSELPAATREEVRPWEGTRHRRHSVGPRRLPPFKPDARPALLPAHRVRRTPVDRARRIVLLQHTFAWLRRPRAFVVPSGRTRSAVAARVLWSRVDAPVNVTVLEVPRLPRNDGPATPRTLDTTRGHPALAQRRSRTPMRGGSSARTINSARRSTPTTLFRSPYLGEAMSALRAIFATASRLAARSSRSGFSSESSCGVAVAPGGDALSRSKTGPVALKTRTRRYLHRRSPK